MFRSVLVSSLLLTACAAAASGHLSPAPEGAAILTVGGDIGCTNHGDEAAFDLAALDALAGDELRTTTIWTEGVQIFEGVRIDTLLEAVCAEAASLRASAINEYSVDIPLNQELLEGALIAYRRNGVPMTLRDKGPLWIVFPWDDDHRYRNEAYYFRSVWQLERLDVIE